MPRDNDSQLVTLGYLLYALGILFGITAIMGAIISHSRYHRVESPVARLHLRVQLISFWLASLLLAIALWRWPSDTATGVMVAAVAVWISTWSIGLLQLRRSKTVKADQAPADPL